MKRIAVTGGSGMIGVHIVHGLQQQGYAVTNFDSTKCPAPDIYTVRLDLLDYGEVVGCLQGFDGIVHLAAIAAPERASNARTYGLNVQSTFHVLEAAAQLRINKVVLASSINALGLAYNLTRTIHYAPLDEAHPCTPDEAYSLSKLVGEITADGFARRYPEMSIASLRLPGVFTPQMFRNYQPTIEYMQRTLWSYADVHEVARAVHAALTATWRGHEVFMIAAPTTPFETPSRELMARYYPEAELRAELADTTALVSCEKAWRLLGWKHERCLNDSLRAAASTAGV